MSFPLHVSITDLFAPVIEIVVDCKSYESASALGKSIEGMLVIDVTTKIKPYMNGGHITERAFKELVIFGPAGLECVCKSLMVGHDSNCAWKAAQ